MIPRGQRERAARANRLIGHGTALHRFRVADSCPAQSSSAASRSGVCSVDLAPEKRAAARPPNAQRCQKAKVVTEAVEFEHPTYHPDRLLGRNQDIETNHSAASPSSSATTAIVGADGGAKTVPPVSFGKWNQLEGGGELTCDERQFSAQDQSTCSSGAQLADANPMSPQAKPSHHWHAALVRRQPRMRDLLQVSGDDEIGPEDVRGATKTTATTGTVASRRRPRRGASSTNPTKVDLGLVGQHHLMTLLGWSSVPQPPPPRSKSSLAPQSNLNQSRLTVGGAQTLTGAIRSSTGIAQAARASRNHSKPSPPRERQPTKQSAWSSPLSHRNTGVPSPSTFRASSPAADLVAAALGSQNNSEVDMAISAATLVAQKPHSNEEAAVPQGLTGRARRGTPVENAAFKSAHRRQGQRI